VLNRAQLMRDACARHGVPLPAAALQFTLHHPAVTAAVIGARSADEITIDVSYLKTPIPDALWAELHIAGQAGTHPNSAEDLGYAGLLVPPNSISMLTRPQMR
jgi:D-threo-aldose 1-dehydrogenase